MADMKLIADIVTTIRGFMAFILVWIGLVLGKGGLSYVVYIMIACWTGDFFDGRLARASRRKRLTWIGSHDLQVDLFVSLGLAGYLIWSGYVSGIALLAYLLVWGIVIWKKGPDRNLLMLFQSPIYGIFIYITLVFAPEHGKWILIWLVCLLAINWKNFINVIIPGFISGMVNLFRHNGDGRAS